MPNVPFLIMRPIDALSIAHVKRLEHPLQSIVGCRNGNQVNMIGHEAIRKHFNLAFIAIFLEPQQICFAIFVGEKDVIAPISPLRYVMGYSGKNCSR